MSNETHKIIMGAIQDGGVYPIDNGFKIVSKETALNACGKLPKIGYFAVGEWNGKRCEVHRTIYGKRMYWAIANVAK